MSYPRQPNRNSFQQNNGQSPNGNNQQRSPQIKKHHSCPAWGSGALHPNQKNGNGHFAPPSPLTSPPSFNVTSPTFNFTSPPPPQYQQFRPSRNGNYTSPRQQGFGRGGHSPNYMNHGNNYGGNMFRTPQPFQRYNTSPQKSWSCDRNYRPGTRLNMKSPRRNPNLNPGGSNDIEQYYHPAMLEDPWQRLAPVPVTRAPVMTT